MKVTNAISMRIKEILKARKMSQYRLEQLSGVSHNTMICLLNSKYKSCNLVTIMLIIRALDMTVSEFFDHEIFESEDLILEQ